MAHAARAALHTQVGAQIAADGGRDEDIALALTGNDRVAARNLSRAVGSACADNPIPIFVPCHRVIGKDGRLVGFSGGVENKEFLLEHEIFGFFREVSTKGEVECHFYG